MDDAQQLTELDLKRMAEEREKKLQPIQDHSKFLFYQTSLRPSENGKAITLNEAGYNDRQAVDTRKCKFVKKEM